MDLRKARMAAEKFTGGERRMTDLDVPVRNEIMSERPDVMLLNTMLLDPGISFPLHLLKLPITRSNLVYTNPDADIQKFVRGELKELKRSLLFDALTALEHGYAAFERRYVLRDSMYHYKEFVHLNPLYLWIRVNEKTKGFNGIRQQYKTGIVDLKPEKSYIFSHEAYFSNLYGNSQIKYAYVPWLLDKEFYRYHGLALQEFGLQTLVGRAPEGDREVDMGEAGKQTISNLEFIKLIGEAVRSRTVVTYPMGEGWDLSALFKDTRNTWDFNKDHDFLDLKKALAILVPPELWRSGGGSYAKAKVQSFWFEQTIGTILDELTYSVMRHIVKPIIKLNFWDGRKEPSYGEIDAKPPSLEYQEFAQKLLLSKESKEVVNWEALFRMLRIPVTSGDDEEFGIENIPASIKTLEDFCHKAFTTGIVHGKSELSYTGMVPLTNDAKKMLAEEARKMQFIARNASSPREGFQAILSRLRAEGREVAHDFFYKQIKDGQYHQLTKGSEHA